MHIEPFTEQILHCASKKSRDFTSTALTTTPILIMHSQTWVIQAQDNIQLEM